MYKYKDIAVSDLPTGVTLTEFKGILYMHLGTDWIQGAMRLSNPNALVIKYIQNMMIWMLFNNDPKHIVQLGLGSGALTKFCHKYFPQTKVTAIENNPNVIKTCRRNFFLPDDNSFLQVIEMDAKDYISTPKNKGSIDVLQVDIYDAQAQAPVFDTPEFYSSCAKALSEDGIMTVNVFGEQSNKEQTISYIEENFDAVVDLPEVDGGNTVVLAFKKSPIETFKVLENRAIQIQTMTKLKTMHWVENLKIWMCNEPN